MTTATDIPTTPLRRHRLKLNLTQRDLAFLAGVDERTIREHEQRAYLSRETGPGSAIHKIARALNVSLEDLRPPTPPPSVEVLTGGKLGTAGKLIFDRAATGGIAALIASLTLGQRSSWEASNGGPLLERGIGLEVSLASHRLQANLADGASRFGGRPVTHRPPPGEAPLLTEATARPWFEAQIAGVVETPILKGSPCLVFIESEAVNDDAGTWEYLAAVAERFWVCIVVVVEIDGYPTAGVISPDSTPDLANVKPSRTYLYDSAQEASDKALAAAGDAAAGAREHQRSREKQQARADAQVAEAKELQDKRRAEYKRRAAQRWA